MRHILTMLIAFHWMAVFAMLAIVSTLDPRARRYSPRCACSAPLPCLMQAELGGGPLAAAFLAVRICRRQRAVPVDLADGVAGRRLLWRPVRSGRAPCLRLRRRRPVAAVDRRGAASRCPGLFVTSAHRPCGTARLLSRGLRRALGGVVPFRTRRCRPARRRARHGGRCCAQRDADQAFRPRQRETSEVRPMKYLFAIWAAPLVLFWGWFYLSLTT